MDPAKVLELKALTRQGDMNAVIDKFSSPVQQFYSGAKVFVTGGSGFVGKQLIEKLLRSCKINKINLLMRPKHDKPISSRLDEIFKDPVYDNLHKNQPEFLEKIFPIDGDVAQLGLGLNDFNKTIITEEVDIIFHVAATIRFDEPLGIATITNVRGTREILELAKQCKKLRALVHVSTAYVYAKDSYSGSTLREQFYPSPMSPDIMIQLAETFDEGKLNAITKVLLQDWPNTYSFTKALAEELIRTTAGDLPICIIRPTIVICTNCEPSPGWIDISSVFGPSGITLGCNMGLVHSLRVRKEVKTDLMPTDFLNNAVIAAAWEIGRRKQMEKRDIKIYTISSSARNPFEYDSLCNSITTLARSTVVSPQAVWYCFSIMTTNDWVFMVLNFFLQDVPGAIIDAFCVLMKKPPRLTKIYSTWYKIQSALKYYMDKEWTFDDQNTVQLYESLSKDDKAIFNFDITKVDWTEQCMLWCIGIRKYVIKDGLKDTEWGIKKQFYFKILTYMIGGLVLLFLWTFLHYIVYRF